MSKKSSGRIGGTWRPVRRSRIYPIVTRAQKKRWATASDNASYLHATYLAHRDRLLPKYFGKFGEYPVPKGIGARLRWYILDVGWGSWRQLRQNGSIVRRQTGLSFPRQLWQMLSLAIRQPTSPKSYYRNEMYRPEVRARANEYLYRYELKGVLYRLTIPKGADISTVSPLTDKHDFATQARDNDLPVASSLAVISEGKVVEAADELPPIDLFVKPKNAQGGKGAQLWRYVEEFDSYFREKNQKTVARSKFLDYLCGKAKRSIIVQPKLSVHHDLAEVALDALPTIRLITFTNEDGEPEIVAAAMRMPRHQHAIVDNSHAGGIAAAINLEEGTLGQWTSFAFDETHGHDTHPVTGAAIAGRKIPDWHDVVNLTHRAHRAFAPRALVGWDICITDQGPILVEGNAQPGDDPIQRLSGEPFGNSRFGQLLAHHIKRQLGE